MFIVHIALNKPDGDADAALAAARFDQHRQWFTTYFQQGHFLLLGPYLDLADAGVIVAVAENRAALEQMLAQDVYYPLGLATYDVHEFRAAMVADNVSDYLGH